MHDDEVRARCHDRDLRSKVYAGFKTNLAYIRDSRINGQPWSDIVTGLVDKGVAGATIHRLLAWVRTPRFGAWELDKGQPMWVVKVGVGKGLRSVEARARSAASFPSPLPSRMIAQPITQSPESFIDDEPDLPAITSRLSDDELRKDYADVSKTIREAIAAQNKAYNLERKLKSQLAKEMASRGITDIPLDPEDVIS